MKAKRLIILFLFFNLSILHAQREAGIWYFGNQAGLDFNSGTPIALTDGKLITNEGCSSISDFNGNLLFYTDGSTVWDAHHNVMPNGNGLLGHKSSTQSAIIVPNPSNPSIYYIFTVDQPDDKNADDNLLNDTDDGVNDGLNYTEINMGLNSGLGDVNPLRKNIHLITYRKNSAIESRLKCSEKITAVQHADGNSYWVITHFINTFYAFKISNSGVQTNPIKSSTDTGIPLGGYLPNAIGYLKSSPNGKKLAIAHQASRSSNESGPKGVVRNTGRVLLYDFNNSTGSVSNQTSLLSNVNPYGIEFSSKSKKLYVTTNHYDSSGNPEGSSLFQFDLKSNNIPVSKTLIVKNDFVAGALQLAIDEKIYRAGYKIRSKGGDFISVINNPEESGTSCNFKINEISLKGKNVMLGLPPFIQSLFLFNFKYEFTCYGDLTHFYISTLETIDTVVWDFGDGTTSTDFEAYHQYNAPGTYTVTLTKTSKSETKDPITKEVVIKEKPLILDSIFELIQCDSFDNNPNDELATFNLENSIGELTLNNTDDFNVYFYLNDIDAENDTYNENSIPSIYKNTTPNQLLTAKVVDKESDCYSLGKVALIANSSILINTSDFIGCDIGDGTAEFNFSVKENEIKSSLNLPNSVVIYFYDSEENAINNISPLNNAYISSEKVIYFKAENNGTCYGSGKFNLIVNFFPPVEPNKTLYVCKNNFPLNINAGIPLDVQQEYDYIWSNGENSHEITVQQEQQISVIIIDKVLQCEKVKSFDIVSILPPNIIDVVINQNEKTVTVLTANNFDNLYALDNPYGEYQTDNIFLNVPPGTHNLYIQNKYNCGVTNKIIFVLGFPKFFTPNNDGINDFWEIKGLNFEEFTYSNIYIFDRFGKNIATINPNSSWDGIYHGKFLQATDYWFLIDITDRENITKTYKGHFSLIRQ